MASYKNQHYIPQQYFNKWGAMDEQNHKNIELIPFILDKKTNEIKQKSVKKICSESYFYGIEEIPEYEFLQLINFIEKRIQQINFKNSGVRNEGISFFMNYLLCILKEVSKTEKSQIIVEKVYTSFIELGAKSLESFKSKNSIFKDEHIFLYIYINSFEFRTLKFKKEVKQRYYKEFNNVSDWNKLSIYLMILDSILEGAYLYENYVHFYDINITNLITNDYPLITYNDNIKIFPVSPNRYFILSKICIYPMFPLDKINTFIFQNADKYVISSDKKILEKLRDYFNK